MPTVMENSLGFFYDGLGFCFEGKVGLQLKLSEAWVSEPLPFSKLAETAIKK